MSKQLRNKFIISSIYTVLPHVVFFWIRMLGFFTLYVFSIAEHIKFVRNTDTDSADDFVYIIQFGLFQLYFVSKSLIHGNIFGFYLGIALMIHNTVLTLFAPKTSPADLSKKYWVVLYLI
ncbi:uncharacterized protein VICG_02080, partial [Vittaforma corneae ATCC 50505]